jgi:N-acetylmuramoyl-L-alanine amidase
MLDVIRLFSSDHTLDIPGWPESWLLYKNLQVPMIPVSYCGGDAILFFYSVYQNIWMYFRNHRVASIIAGHALVMMVLALVWSSSAFAPNLFGAFAKNICASGDKVYVVRSGDTLSSIATLYGMNWQNLSTHNHLTNPNMLLIGQQICIPGKSATSTRPTTGNVTPTPVHKSSPVIGLSNPFPYGQCTWWASQRYFQLHGVYIPWHTNANAWQWTARASDFHWNVSTQPSSGAIIDLQPGVQGAGSLGHVGVVERILGNGHVVASSMNWGPNYTQVTDFEFRPGTGVTFISI